MCFLVRPCVIDIPIRTDTLSHINRREYFFLMNFRKPLAHKFKRGAMRCKY